jgi:thymidylate synthase
MTYCMVAQLTTTTKNEQTYLDSLRYVFENGKPVVDRTGIGTKRKFALTNRYDLNAGFPLLTTKKIDLKSVSSELIWFLEGSGDERRLAEIRFGKPRAEIESKKTIWTENAQADYWKPKAEFDGDLGRVYGVQWRHWRTPFHSSKRTPNYGGAGSWDFISIDQIKNLIKGIKNDPYGRRHIITAWNPGELDQMALPPCHVLSQFFVEEGRLSSILYQRSCDKFLGEPYNIASYALFTHMIAQVCGLEVDEFVHVMVDAHIYSNHHDAVTEQLARVPVAAPQLIIDPNVTDIDQFTVDSFSLEGYDPQPAIKASMAV